MKFAALFATLIGLAILVYLVLANGGAAIETAIASAGFGILWVVAAHFPQSLFSSLGWRAVVPTGRKPSAASFFGFRLIRESINGLLPVGQVGGEFVNVRLLGQRGVPLSSAGASLAVDKTLEIVSQIAFTLLGMALLMLDPAQADIIHWIGGALVGAVAVIAAFILAQRFGLFRLLEQGVLKLARKQQWKGAESLVGLHDEIVALYKSPRRLVWGTVLHLVSWMLGAVEIWVALHVVGIDVDPRAALIIESLGQAFKSLGFAIPGALGVQEGGLILACGLVGVNAQGAIELSLLKRIRELTIGVPGLLAWQWIEGKRLFGPAKKLSGETS
ncbi:MAG TPA: flippase-like domain-containing protein [Magnetospirillaceae bacterium]|nr:flippase-like domain-containing protein [Magnetospirillaceae bacterium]